MLVQTDPWLRQQICPVTPGDPGCFWQFWCLWTRICSLLVYCALPAGTLWRTGRHSCSSVVFQNLHFAIEWLFTTNIQRLEPQIKIVFVRFVFTNLCGHTGTRGRAGSDRRHRKQPCSREGGRTHRGGQWDNKALSTLQLGHLGKKEKQLKATL